MIELRSRTAALWSVPAALRAVRAALVAPGLFALTAKGIGWALGDISGSGDISALFTI
jgi:hypothetical protein